MENVVVAQGRTASSEMDSRLHSLSRRACRHAGEVVCCWSQCGRALGGGQSGHQAAAGRRGLFVCVTCRACCVIACLCQVIFAIGSGDSPAFFLWQSCATGRHRHRHPHRHPHPHLYNQHHSDPAQRGSESTIYMIAGKHGSTLR